MTHRRRDEGPLDVVSCASALVGVLALLLAHSGRASASPQVIMLHAGHGHAFQLPSPVVPVRSRRLSVRRLRGVVDEKLNADDFVYNPQANALKSQVQIVMSRCMQTHLLSV